MDADADRDARRESMQKKQDVDKLLIGESRKGVITKVRTSIIRSSSVPFTNDHAHVQQTQSL